MNDIVIETRNLTRYYGEQRGIQDLNLAVRRGEVFGFLGPNGAGKTTTLRILLDIIHPSGGQAAIFGLDCQRQGVQIRTRVGYLPGEFRPYLGMRGQAFLDLFASLQAHPVDPRYRDELCQQLDLDPTRKIKHYSHGNRQKLGIVAAFMGRPDLLILDDPTIGLDPLVQKALLDLVRAARQEGRTVFFSSHNLAEVQAVCDRVGMIREGALIQTERVESLTKRQFKRLQLCLQQTPPAGAFDLDGVSEIGRDGNRVSLEVRQGLAQVMEIAAGYGIEDIEIPAVTLDEIFLAFYDRSGEGDRHA